VRVARALPPRPYADARTRVPILHVAPSLAPPEGSRGKPEVLDIAVVLPPPAGIRPPPLRLQRR
jgi:hypothetical protein